MEKKKESREPEKKLLAVRVRPGSRRAGVEMLSPGEYRVSVISVAERGEANREVVARLAEHLGVPPSRVRIVRGEKSQLKLVAIDFDA